MTNLTPYFKSAKTDVIVIPSNQGIDHNSSQLDNSSEFKIVMQDYLSSPTTTLFLTMDGFEKGLRTLVNLQINESLLIEAIRNFIRKDNFNELNDALDDEEITNDEYENELNKNSFKYAIRLKDIYSPNEAISIMQLIEKIGGDLRDFSTSEISEMFSVKENQLVSIIKSIIPRIK